MHYSKHSRLRGIENAGQGVGKGRYHFTWGYVSYLWLHNKLPHRQWLKIIYTYYLIISVGQEFAPGFTGVLCIRVSLKTSLKSVGQGWDAIWMLSWGRIHFCSLWFLAELIFCRAVGTEGLRSSLVPTGGCPEFLALWTSLLHERQRERASASKTEVTVLCNIITEVIYPRLWFYVLNLQFYRFEVTGERITQRHE